MPSGRAQTSPQEYTALRDALLANGVQSSVNWYRAQVENVNLEDSLSTYGLSSSGIAVSHGGCAAGIPKEAWKLKAPSVVFLALKDYVCTPQAAKASMEKYGVEVAYYDVESGHWPHLERADEVNDALRGWLEGHGW